MLPSTGLFKAINCPYYEDGKCVRPFCHFKHTKKEDDATKAKPLVYNATPKSILEGDKTETPTEPPAKKKKLEYIPLNITPSFKKVNTPTYIPSGLTVTSQADLSLDEIDEELSLISDIIETETRNNEEQISNDVTPCYIPTGITSKDNKSVKDKENVEEISQIQDNDNLNSGKTVILDLNDEKLKNLNERSSKSREQNHKSSKSSTSSHNKEKDISSSSKSHRKSSSGSSSNKDRRRNSSNSKDSSERSSSKHERNSSHSHSRHSNSSKNIRSNSSKTDSSRHRDHKRHSSRSSSSNHKEKSPKSRESKLSPRHDGKIVESVKNGKTTGAEDFALSIYESSSDDDDVMAQCKLIFEEFNSAAVSNESEPEKEKNKLFTPDPLECYDDANKRKRVAHESASSSKLIISHQKKVNHVQNAMQSVFLRQEIVRKQLELAAANNNSKIETSTSTTSNTMEIVVPPDKTKQRIAHKSSHSSIEIQPLKLSPIMSPPPALMSPPHSSCLSHNTSNVPQPQKRTIAPVSNILAIQNAKKKVEELRLAKQQRTIAQTVSKATARVAHSNAPTADLNTKPSPPVLEPTSTRISYNLRMQYYNMMIKHCLNVYPNCEDAWERAQTEELAIMKKCSSAVIYKSSASLTVNKLRKESIEAGNVGTEKNNVVSHDVMLAGKLGQRISWSINNKIKTNSSGAASTFDSISSDKAYNLLFECILTEEQLKENGYPRPGKQPGQAIVSGYYSHNLKPRKDYERYCCRCSNLYNIDCYDEPAIDQCNYHPKSTGFRRGFADNLHRCCQQAAGTAGCMYANYHVSDYADYDNLTGFVTTISRDEDFVCTRKDIYALDCEMCYTTMGLELTRVTVVDINEKTVYDALIKPDNKIVDYNTTYSGITETMLSKETKSLRQVQAVLLSMFHSRTILVGHSLDSDLKALKMIHNVVVDTSVLYPHKMGPPKKRALKTLCIENLKKIIQENDAGHDSAEDAEVCIQLVKHYLRNRIV